MTQGAKHQRFLDELAKLHDAALSSSDDKLNDYRMAFRRRLRDASLRRHAPEVRATPGMIKAALEPSWVWWLVATGATTLLVLGIFVHRAVQPTKSVEVGPEHVAASVENPVVSAKPASSTEPVRDPCVAGVVAAGNKPLIDDFEDNNPLIAPFENRVGLWSLFKDTDSSATFSPLSPELRIPATSKNRYALHVAGGELLNWGAVVQVSFQPSCYDASAYSGISFSAKGPGRLYVGMREVSVVPVEFGGTCKSDCYNGHQKKVDLSAHWRSYTVLWSEMRQRGYNSKALDPKRLNGIALLIQSADTPYNLWIDDVKFVTP